MNSSAIIIRREAVILFVAGSKGVMVNIVALLTPVLPLVAVPEYVFTFKDRWTYPACINATVNCNIHYVYPSEFQHELTG